MGRGSAACRFDAGQCADTDIHRRRTLVFTAAAALFIGLLTGLAPVLLVSKAALSGMLLVGAGLFVRSLSNLQSMRLGYDSANAVARHGRQ